MRISIKRPTTSTALTGVKLATTSAFDLDTELVTNFPSNPSNYDPSQFGGLTYEELAAKLAVLQPPNIPQKSIKKKTPPIPVLIDPSPKKKKISSPSPSTPEDELKGEADR